MNQRVSPGGRGSTRWHQKTLHNQIQTVKTNTVESGCTRIRNVPKIRFPTDWRISFTISQELLLSSRWYCCASIVVLLFVFMCIPALLSRLLSPSSSCGSMGDSLPGSQSTSPASLSPCPLSLVLCQSEQSWPPYLHRTHNYQVTSGMTRFSDEHVQKHREEFYLKCFSPTE